MDTSRLVKSGESGPIVIVSEDEYANQAVLWRLLSKLMQAGQIGGFRICVTGEALVANVMSLLQQGDDLLVISDRNLGTGIDGLEVLEHVWMVDPTIPALVATGDHLPSLYERWEAMGLTAPEDYIFSKGAILEILRSGLPPMKSAPPRSL